MATKGEWTKIKGGTAKHWRHSTGWHVHHCGHPTANWPYAVFSPEGFMYVHPCGYAFRLLVLAQDAVESALPLIAAGKDFSQHLRRH